MRTGKFTLCTGARIENDSLEKQRKCRIATLAVLWNIFHSQITLQSFADDKPGCPKDQSRKGSNHMSITMTFFLSVSQSHVTCYDIAMALQISFLAWHVK